mmetsp:Transcript_14126/g.42639  ORF Transcript_14126/g.42639 Transcript_14126/m.42639 type:complete len:325 (-) Transcript_14126:499-1473(-)
MTSTVRARVTVSSASSRCPSAFRCLTRANSPPASRMAVFSSSAWASCPTSSVANRVLSALGDPSSMSFMSSGTPPASCTASRPGSSAATAASACRMASRRGSPTRSCPWISVPTSNPTACPCLTAVRQEGVVAMYPRAWATWRVTGFSGASSRATRAGSPPSATSASRYPARACIKSLICSVATCCSSALPEPSSSMRPLTTSSSTPRVRGRSAEGATVCLCTAAGAVDNAADGADAPLADEADAVGPRPAASAAPPAEAAAADAGAPLVGEGNAAKDADPGASCEPPAPLEAPSTGAAAGAGRGGGWYSRGEDSAELCSKAAG